MGWVALLKALLGVCAALADYVRDKNLIDAGEAQAISDSVRVQLARIEKARAARRAVSDDPRDILSDQDRRD